MESPLLPVHIRLCFFSTSVLEMFLLLIAFFSLVKNAKSEILVFVWVRIWLLNHSVHFERSVCRIVVPPIPGAHFHINLYGTCHFSGYQFSVYIPKDGIEIYQEISRELSLFMLMVPPIEIFQNLCSPLCILGKLLFSLPPSPSPPPPPP